jgi:hypothetical protein
MPDEIRDVLGEDGEVFIAAYGVTRHGNFEGKSILEFVGDMDQRPALSEARRTLYDMREKRFHPGLDDKVLTSWNGLMLAAFAEAARALDRDDYRLVAEHNAEFLLRELRQENGRLLRTWKQGETKLNGYLEDCAYFIKGLLEHYQATFEPSWFVPAQEPADTMLTRFRASEGVQLARTGQLSTNASGFAGFYDIWLERLLLDTLVRAWYTRRRFRRRQEQSAASRPKR